MLKYALFLSLTLLGIGVQAETLHYEIYRMSDMAPPTLLIKGSKTYSESDFKIKPLKEKHWNKSLELEQGFSIGVTLNQEAKGETFSLWANQNPTDISNEQFKLTKPGVYEKLEEGGLLAVGHRTTNDRQSISSITFDTDISLRIMEKASADDGKASTKAPQQALKTTYRVLIKKGSVLNLPPTPSP